MAWRCATVRLGAPSCPAATALGSDNRLQCQTPGVISGAPFGTLHGPESPRWQYVEPRASPHRGRVARLPDASCQECPFQDPGPGLLVTGVEVLDGAVVARLLFEEPPALDVMMARLRETGQKPEMVACTTPTDVGAPALRVVDRGAFTDRQWAALQAAAELGYFTGGPDGNTKALAKRLGCSPATANELLRKALAKLAEGLRDPPRKLGSLPFAMTA